MKKNHGFTLIEILVTVICLVIIALSAIRAVYGAIEKSRDNRVVADFNMLQKGLAEFYVKYYVYPCGDNYDQGNGAMYKEYTVDTTNDGVSFLQGNTNDPASTEYADVVSHCAGVQFGLQQDNIISSDILKPIDHPHPGGNPWTYGYEVDSTRKSYILFTVLENNPARMASDHGKCKNVYEVGNGVGVIPPRVEDLGLVCIP